MTRTFVKGRKNFKRMDHKHGHCIICGYEPGRKARKRNEQKLFFKIDIIPYLVLERIIS